MQHPVSASLYWYMVHKNVAPGGAHGTSQGTRTTTIAEAGARSGMKAISSDDGTQVEAGAVTPSGLISAADADAAHVDMVNGVPVPPTETGPTGREMEHEILEDQDSRATVASMPPSTSNSYLRWRCPPGYAKCGLMCWPCRAGYYSLGLSRWCVPCPVGTMSAAKSSGCTRCSTLGRGYTTRSAGRAVCDKCLPGYAGKSCTPCGHGKYSLGGLRSSRLACHSCPTGYTTKTRTAARRVACVTSGGEHWQVSNWVHLHT